MEIKNHYLNKVISRIGKRNVEDISQSLFDELSAELVFSKVFCPFKDYEFVLDDDRYIIAFTTYDKYIQFYDEKYLEIFEFVDSLLYTNSDEGDGVILNPNTDDFKLSIEVLDYMRVIIWNLLGI